MDYGKAINDLNASLENINGAIELFQRGNVEAYRLVSVELRKLLCDGKNSLLPRLFEGIKLHPVRRSPELKKLQEKFGMPQKGVVVFESPALIGFDGKGGSKIVELFDQSEAPIELNEWLAQPIFNEQISVEGLIRSVSDKLGAHSDKEYNQTLKFTKSVKLVNEDIHVKYVVAIGEYVLNIAQQLYSQIKKMNNDK